jgi:penicillin-binding protein 1A
VGPLALAVTTAARWSRDERRFYLEEARVTVGPRAELTLRASGDAQLTLEGLVRARAVVEAPEVAALVAALPAGLRPPAEAPALQGPLAGEIALEGPWESPLDWEVTGKLDLARMRALARKSPPGWLQQSFELRWQEADGHDQVLTVGPESPDFVALADLPAHVADAVVTSEDGGFYGHQGFDFDEIKRSLVAVAEASGRAVRGGSTISQQLAKNLFLSREKTYVRKAREALVTLALESTLSKQRLLEIYLNVIEWGPGIRGVGPAARTYFGKSPCDLTPREAAYLASVIPNPVRYFAQYERGELSAEWGTRLDTILTNMTMNGRLAPDAYAEALRAPIVFRLPD